MEENNSNLTDDFDSLPEIESKAGDYKANKMIIGRLEKAPAYSLEKGRFKIVFNGIQNLDELLFEVYPCINNNGIYSISGCFLVSFPLSLTGEIDINFNALINAAESILVELN
jgi:hypothetical protein